MAFKLGKSVFMLLGQGGRKEGAAENPGRAFIVFVSARNIGAAEKLAHKVLAERGWEGVIILRGAEAKEKPSQKPHDEAWAEARAGRRGIIVYDTGTPESLTGIEDTPAK